MDKKKNCENKGLSLEVLEAELRQIPGPAVPAGLEDRLLAGTPAAKGRPRGWYRIRLVRVAAAAVVVMAVLGLFAWMTGGNGGTNVVWADVLRNVEQIHTFTLREKRVYTLVGKEKPLIEVEAIMYCSSEYGVVEERYNNDGQLLHQLYFLRGKKEALLVYPPWKEYVRIPLDERTIERLNQIHPEGIVKWFRSDKYTRLGRKYIEGVEVEGFEVRNPRMLTDFTEYAPYLFPVQDSVIRLWVDSKTLLPVRAEAEIVTGKGFLTGFQRMGLKAVAYDMQWGVDIEPEVFAVNIPDNYTEIQNLNPEKKEQ